MKSLCLSNCSCMFVCLTWCVRRARSMPYGCKMRMFFFFFFWKSQPRHGDCCLGDNIKDQPSLIRVPRWERERMTVCVCVCVCMERKRECEESERERNRKVVEGRERRREREWMCRKNTSVWVGGRRLKENVWVCVWEACMDGCMTYE